MCRVGVLLSLMRMNVSCFIEAVLIASAYCGAFMVCGLCYSRIACA